MKNVMFANAMMWLSTGAAIICAILVTQSATPLCFFIVPLIGGYSYKETMKGGGNCDE